MPRNGMRTKILEYLRMWEQRGYAEGIPDEVPIVLMRENLAPSYKAICFAILRNDAPLQSLGFTPQRSRWYDELKRLELSSRPGVSRRARPRPGAAQLELGLAEPTPK